jgi:hypothetical protein
MRSGGLRLVPAGGSSLDEQTLSEPAEPAALADEVGAPLQKIEPLSSYYDEVVAELLALLDAVHDEGRT